MNFRQIKTIESTNKKRILEICPTVTEQSGIYIFTREENGFRYGYVGQAKHLLTRLARHLKISDQHIDKSIKTHGLWSEQNLTGWRIEVRKFEEERLNEKEQYFIKLLADKGFQLRNKTSGSQGEGKFGIAENKPAKGYYDGIARGKELVLKEISKLYKQSQQKNINGGMTLRAKSAEEKLIEILKGEKHDNL